MRKLLLSLLVTLAPLAAHADVMDTVSAKLDVVGAKLDVVGAKLDAVWDFLGSPQPETGLPAPLEATPIVRLAPLPRAVIALPASTSVAVNDIRMPVAPAIAAPPAPSVEKTAKKLFCVEYARTLSGLAIFGDAKYWWERARNLYARASRPLEEAVMVFSGSSRLKKGHVAVVTDIIGPREIRVEQANWMNKGEIDHATPVLDVSAKNDWSKVRVWDVPSHSYGSRVYAISGFILKPVVREAANN